MTIGEQIQNLRIKKGMTQENLAEILDVSRQSVSKWELGQAIPDIDKVIKLSETLDVSTDTILLKDKIDMLAKKNSLKLMNTCIVTKKFDEMVSFYKKLFGINFSNYEVSNHKVSHFFLDDKCIVVMNEDNLKQMKSNKFSCDIKYGNSFLQNYWVEDLSREYNRVKELLNDLNLTGLTEIMDVYPNYHYFRFTDPDKNIIEINGGYNMNVEMCQSCGMPLEKAMWGKNLDGSDCKDYCKYCFEDGKFTKDLTMEQMAEFNLNFLDDYNEHSEKKMTIDELREYMLTMLPTLKRWKNVK